MERQHIALTEAQIIAAEKGEIQLEYRDGSKVCQTIWFRQPYNQTSAAVKTVDASGEVRNHTINGESRHIEDYDLFISEPSVESELPNDFMKVGEHKTIEGVEYVVCEDEMPNDCAGCDLGEESCRLIKNIKCCNTILKRIEQSPKPLYEVGEIIEQIESAPNGWRDVEFIHAKGDQIVVWYDGQYRPAHKNAFRKKQTEKTVTLEGKVMTVKEAFKYLTNL